MLLYKILLFKNHLVDCKITVFFVFIRKLISWSDFADWFVEMDELGDGGEEVDGVVSGVDRIDLIIIAIV